MNKSIYKKIIIGAFLVVPLFSSIISTVHAVDLFALGNITLMAVALAFVFELGQLSSLMTLAILDKISKGIVWSIFILLCLMQILGNVYYTFDYITHRLVETPEYLSSALELINKFTYNEINASSGKFIISLVIGVPIPLISIAFLKSLVDYLKVDDKNIYEIPKTEKPKEPKIEKTKEYSKPKAEEPKEPKPKAEEPEPKEAEELESKEAEEAEEAEELELEEPEEREIEEQLKPEEPKKETKEKDNYIENLWNNAKKQDSKKSELEKLKPKEKDLGSIKKSFAPYINK